MYQCDNYEEKDYKLVIVAPLSFGAVQFIVTLVPLFVVVGAIGVSGEIACNIVNSADGKP